MVQSISSSSSLGTSSGENNSQSGVQYEPWQRMGIAGALPGIQGGINQAGARMGDYNALLKQIGGVGSGPSAPAYGTQGSGDAPKITVGGVYSPELMQQNVNAIRGFGDATTGGQVAQQNARLAGSGYGANSPLAQQLGVQARMGNAANTQSGVTNFLTQAAGQNAQQRLASEQAQGQMQLGQGQLGVSQQGQNIADYQAQQNQDIQRRQLAQGQYATLAQQQNALLNNLQGYLRPNPFGTSTGSQTSKNASSSVSQTGGGWNPFPGTALDNS